MNIDVLSKTYSPITQWISFIEKNPQPLFISPSLSFSPFSFLLLISNSFSRGPLDYSTSPLYLICFTVEFFMRRAEIRFCSKTSKFSLLLFVDKSIQPNSFISHEFTDELISVLNDSLRSNDVYSCCGRLPQYRRDHYDLLNLHPNCSHLSLASA